MQRIRRSFPGTCLAACCLAVLSACGPGESGGGPDGVPEIERWRAERDLRVGSLDDPDETLTYIRDLEVGADGTIYTLHRQERLVRTFDSAGTFRGVIGGGGEGPGEFRSPLSMGWVADTLWVLDTDGYRFNQFSPEGEFLGSFRVPFEVREDPNSASPPRARGLLHDGTVHGEPVAWSHLVATGQITERVPMLMTRDGRVTDTLSAVPFGNNQWAVYDPESPDRGGSYARQPFADGPLWSFVPGERATIRVDREAPRTADDASFLVTKLSFSGDTLFTREFSFEPEPVTQAEVDSVLDARAAPIGERGFLGATEAQARDWAERTLYRPPFEPLVRDMTVGRDGSIWLQRTVEADSASWLVLDPTGAPRAEVALPAGFDLLEANRDHAWGQERDELDVPYLVRYRVGPADGGAG